MHRWWSNQCWVKLQTTLSRTLVSLVLSDVPEDMRGYAWNPTYIWMLLGDLLQTMVCCLVALVAC